MLVIEPSQIDELQALTVARDTIDVVVVEFGVLLSRSTSTITEQTIRSCIYGVPIIVSSNATQAEVQAALGLGALLILNRSALEAQLAAAIEFGRERAEQLRNLQAARADPGVAGQAKRPILTSEHLLGHLAGSLARRARASEAEQRVLRHLLRARSQSQIATALNRSPQTIRTQTRSLLRKLNLESVRDLWGAALSTLGTDWLAHVLPTGRTKAGPGNGAARRNDR